MTVIVSMPLRPSHSDSHMASTLFPIGVTHPRPVTTTRRLIDFFFPTDWVPKGSLVQIEDHRRSGTPCLTSTSRFAYRLLPLRAQSGDRSVAPNWWAGPSPRAPSPECLRLVPLKLTIWVIYHQNRFQEKLNCHRHVVASTDFDPSPARPTSITPSRFMEKTKFF